MTTQTEQSVGLLTPELLADIAARVAAAPAPSPRKVGEIRRLFAAVPLQK